jgi:hypothetical protein
MVLVSQLKSGNATIRYSSDFMRCDWTSGEAPVSLSLLPMLNPTSSRIFERRSTTSSIQLTCLAPSSILGYYVLDGTTLGTLKLLQSFTAGAAERTLWHLPFELGDGARLKLNPPLVDRDQGIGKHWPFQSESERKTSPVNRASCG